MTDILEKLKDLHKQAVEERSHYYTGSCVLQAITEIAALEARVCELEAENARLQALFWLAAHDIIFFSQYNTEKRQYDSGFHPCVNCGDTFAYACADAEDIPPGDEEKVKSIFEEWDWDGVVAWIALKRGYEPIAPFITEKYLAARAALKG